MQINKNDIFNTDYSMSLNMPDELQNPTILQINRLDARTTIVPAQKSGVYYRNKEESDYIFSLNGDYSFALFSDEAPSDFMNIDFDESSFDTLDVPSMWQYRGYAQPTYPNTEYAFPFNPPYIGMANPVGCYRREFTVDEVYERAVLHFEGVDNAFYVYINGEFVGFSKGSRVPAEFDITNLLKKGKNLIAVKVYTYSDASYLENQDMLLASGIFRDVYIIFSNKCSVFDYSVITDTEKAECKVTLFEECKNAKAKLTLGDESVEMNFIGKELSYVFKPEQVKLWTAETPNLYDFTIELFDGDKLCETHSKRIGFRTSKTEETRFKINDVPVIVRGINRHEHNCDNGRSITVEQIYNDLALLKKSNINAVRCSHYPNNPAFYEYATELGIYVMDEADCETHGCGVTGDQGMLSKNPLWESAFLDRTVRMYEREKNETCVVIWSVGNECGWGESLEKCYKYLQNKKGCKPILFNATQKTDCTDFTGTGYCSLEQYRAAANSALEEKKPLMLIEFAHAMGNSPGGLERLWDEVLNTPHCMGGYVWEFKNHGKRRINDDGSVDYLYGGDFYDDNHWSNFTLDGYLTSDGTEKPTFFELKYIYSPIRFELSKNVLTIKNINSFTDTSNLHITAELLCDGKTTMVLNQNMPKVLPLSSLEVPLKLDYSGCSCYLTIKAFDNDNQIALKQFKLESTCKKQPLELTPIKAKYEKNKDNITITGENFLIKFQNGVPCYYSKNNKCYFDEPMTFVVHRADIDNDGVNGLFERWIRTWELARLNKMHHYTESTVIEDSDDAISVTASIVIAATRCYTRFKLIANYRVSNDGLLTTKLCVMPFGFMPQMAGVATPRLPRFGVCFKMDKAFNKVRWLGRGEKQNYTDCKFAAPVGVYELPIDDLNFLFDVPQETGTRTDTEYIQLKDTENSFTVYGNDCFSFSYHPWSLKNLRDARHRSELKEDSSNYLYIDYRMRALGSFSCGPNPEIEEDFEPHNFQFVFAINGEEIKETPDFFLRDFGDKTEKLSNDYVQPIVTESRNTIECKSINGYE